MLDAPFRGKPFHVYRCAACMVGGIGEICWCCGTLMEPGDVAALAMNYRKTDDSMRDACTSFAPAVPLEYKEMDGLVWPHDGRFVSIG